MQISFVPTITFLLAVFPPISQCVQILSDFQAQEKEFESDRHKLFSHLGRMQQVMYGANDPFGHGRWPGLAKITRALNKYVPAPEPTVFEKEMKRRQRYYPAIMMAHPEKGIFHSEFMGDIIHLGDWGSQIRELKLWERFLPEGETGYGQQIKTIDKWIWAWRKTGKALAGESELVQNIDIQQALEKTSDNLDLLHRLKETILNPRWATVAVMSRELPNIVASWFPNKDPGKSKLPFEVDDYLRALTRGHGTKNSWWEKYIADLRHRTAMDARNLVYGGPQGPQLPNHPQIGVAQDGVPSALNRAKHMLFVRLAIESQVLQRVVELLANGMGTSTKMLNQMGLGIEEKMTNVARIAAHGQRGWKNRREFRHLRKGNPSGYGINQVLSKLLNHEKPLDGIAKEKSMAKKTEHDILNLARDFAIHYQPHPDWQPPVTEYTQYTQ